MANEPPYIDFQKILRILPHRYPFIMVDRVLQFEPQRSITGLKNVSANEPFFQGHFPGMPVMPGVLILEGMAQVGAILAYLSEEETIGNKIVYFAGIDGARFRQRVLPGDQLIMKATVNKRKKNIWKLDTTAYVDDKLVTEAQLMATFA